MTVAIAEGSFSKVDILKHYRRSTACQKRLRGNEQNKGGSLDWDSAVKMLVSKNVRSKLIQSNSANPSKYMHV